MVVPSAVMPIGAVQPAVFDGDPTVRDERASVAEWTFGIPEKYKDAADYIAGDYLAMGYHAEKPVYEKQDDSEVLIMWREVANRWEVVHKSQSDINPLAWARGKDEITDHPPRMGWVVCSIDDSRIIAGVKFDVNIIEETYETEFKGGEQETEIKGGEQETGFKGGDEKKRKREDEYDIMELQNVSKFPQKRSIWGRVEEQERVGGPAETVDEGRAEAQAGGWRGEPRMPPRPPAPARSPLPPGTAPPQHLLHMQRRPPAQQADQAGPRQPRGGWFNKAQRLCRAVLECQAAEAHAMAEDWYCGPEQHIFEQR